MGISNQSSESQVKIDTIDKIVALDNLSPNSSQETMEDTIKHILILWQDDKLISNNENKMLENLYILSYLNRKLPDYQNFKVVNDTIFDMYQVVKDTLRDEDSSIDANIYQIEKNMKKVLSQMDIPYEEPTEKPTQKSTEKPTEKLTQKPTVAPTQKPTEKPTVAPTQSQNERMVWIPTKGGTKYHKDSSCSNMEDPIQVTVEEAIKNNFSACKRCYE